MRVANVYFDKKELETVVVCMLSKRDGISSLTYNIIPLSFEKRSNLKGCGKPLNLNLAAGATYQALFRIRNTSA